MKIAVVLFLLSQVTESIERQDCVPGTYRDNVMCSECPPGFYQGTPGQTFCFPCPEDRTTTAPGAFSPQHCRLVSRTDSDRHDQASCAIQFSVCKQGFYTSGYWCVLCPLGTYSDEVGIQMGCKPCPASTSTLREGSTTMAHCLNQMQLKNCPPGNFFDTVSGACKPCPKGSYQDQEGQSQCNMCPPSTITLTEGASNLTDCVCSAGHYRHVVSETFTWCERCPYDHYQDQLNQAACKPCPSGTTILALGATSPELCVAAGVAGGGVFCQVGEFLSQDSLGGGGICAPCPIGTYNDRGGANACMRCEALMTTRTPGAKSSLDCACSPGTFMQQWCRPCPVGQYQNEFGQRSCKQCPAGRTTGGTGARVPTQCLQDPGSSGNSSTSPRCPVGHFLSVTGLCMWCSVGSYQNERDAPSCKPCPWGSTTLTVGSTHIDACYNPTRRPIPNGNNSANGSDQSENNNQNNDNDVNETTGETRGSTNTEVANETTTETSGNYRDTINNNVNETTNGRSQSASDVNKGDLQNSPPDWRADGDDENSAGSNKGTPPKDGTGNDVVNTNGNSSATEGIRGRRRSAGSRLGTKNHLFLFFCGIVFATY